MSTVRIPATNDRITPQQLRRLAVWYDHIAADYFRAAELHPEAAKQLRREVADALRRCDQLRAAAGRRTA